MMPKMPIVAMVSVVFKMLVVATVLKVLWYPKMPMMSIASSVHIFSVVMWCMRCGSCLRCYAAKGAYLPHGVFGAELL